MHKAFLALLLLLPCLAHAETPPRSAPGAAACPVDLPETPPPGGPWTDAETWAWEQICLGRWADMSRFDDEDSLVCNLSGTEDIPDHRRLRPEFLTLILTREPWKSVPAKPQVNIGCAVIERGLDLENEVIEPELFLANSWIQGGANLLSARFERTLSFQSSTFDGLFNADRMKVGGGLFLRSGASFQGVDLVSASVGGDLEANGSAFAGPFNADGLKVGGSLFLRDGVSFADVALIFARVDGALQMQGSRFNGTVDLTGATVEQDLMLSQAFVEAPNWGAEARLVLRNTTAGALQARKEAWTREDGTPLPHDLTGFVYTRLGGLSADGAGTMADAGPDWFEDWIAAELDHDTVYDPQPYEQLARVLDAEGMAHKAAAVRYAMFRHRDSVTAAEAPWWSVWLFRPAARWIIGYGVYPFWALFWFFGLVALGMVVGSYSGACELRGFWPKLWYSLENALPLVELKQAHKEIDHKNPLVDGFFHFQTVSGFVLATVLVGALSGLAG